VAGLATAAFLYVAATFRDLEERLYVAKWVAAGVVLVTLLGLGRGRLTAQLASPFALLCAAVSVGLLAQLSENLDSRALQVGFGIILTGFIAFVLAPASMRVRWVAKTVWQGLLLGVLAGVVVSLLLGLLHPERALLVEAGRVRFLGYFQRVNSAGWYGFVGVVLVAATTITTHRRAYLLLLPVFIAPVLAANSRGSIVSLVALGTLWLVALFTRTAWRLKLAALAVTLVLVAGIGVSGTQDAWLRLVSPQRMDLSLLTSGRWTNWTNSLAYLEGPLRWTVGRGLSRNVSFVEGSAGLLGGESDNFYVDLIGRAGLLGAVLFIAPLAMIGARLAVRFRDAKRPLEPAGAFFLALFGSVVLYGLVESHMFTAGTLHGIVIWSFLSRAAVQPR